MVTIGDQLNLSNILTLEPRASNVIYVGAMIKVETIPEYLLRVDTYNRYLGLEVLVLYPSGYYSVNDFINFINLNAITYTTYVFKDNLNDLIDINSVGVPNNSIQNQHLASVDQNIIKGRISPGTGNIEDLTPVQVREMLGIEYGAQANNISTLDASLLTGGTSITLHTHSYLNLSNLPTIPSTLAELSVDSTHNTVSVAQILSWTSKAEGNHTHAQLHDIATEGDGISITSQVITNSDRGTVAITAHEQTYDHSGLHTHANKADLDNVSGTNTGDETVSTIKTKLGITTLSGSNTGDEDTASIKTKLGITTLSGSNTGDQDLSGYALTSHTHSEYEPAKGTDDNFVTDAEKIKLDNLSGTNTGDQDLSGLATKVALANAINLSIAYAIALG